MSEIEQSYPKRFQYFCHIDKVEEMQGHFDKAELHVEVIGIPPMDEMVSDICSALDSGNPYSDASLLRSTYRLEPMSRWEKIKYRVRKVYFKMLRIIAKFYKK